MADFAAEGQVACGLLKRCGELSVGESGFTQSRKVRRSDGKLEGGGARGGDQRLGCGSGGDPEHIERKWKNKGFRERLPAVMERDREILERPARSRFVVYSGGLPGELGSLRAGYRFRRPAKIDAGRAITATPFSPRVVDWHEVGRAFFG